MSESRGRGRPKGQPKTGGRVKGTPNKITADVRAALLVSFETVGGAEYLVRLAESEPRSYTSLLAKCIPQQNELTGKDGAPLEAPTYIGGVTAEQLAQAVREALDKV